MHSRIRAYFVCVWWKGLSDRDEHIGLHFERISEHYDKTRRLPEQAQSRLIERVSMKPFSTFSLYSDQEFKECLKNFEKNLYERFGSGEVIYETQYLLLSLTKPAAAATDLE